MAVRRRGRRRAGVSAVAVGTAGAVGVVLVTATGCSGRGAAAAEEKVPRDPLRAVREAPDVLARSGTSSTVTAMEMTSGGTRVTIDGTGAFDYAKRAGRLKILLPEGASGAAVGQRRPITELITPDAVYMKNRGAGVPSDKWVRVETASLSDGNLVTSGATDPVSAAELLRGARQVSYEGERTLDGETVSHYEGTLDLRAAAKAASPHSRRQLEAAAKGFSTKAVPFEADIDERGRLRKVRHEFTVVNGEHDRHDAHDEHDEGGEGASGVAVSSTVRLRDFGTPVRIGMPESRDIYAGTIASP
ncbi:hypothetical protein [Streptomyces daliensis]|uniref:Lipoprotein n=1 Tax=Streptomyces daliensis TaxID=299421 RepID=A0A8T4IUB2_9ACTN|nr:hypothetical protein [Streptomyces daliensis]